MKDTLTGRLALVTGGGHGNGAAIARGLAAAGAEVIVTDIDKEAARTIADLIVADGGKARGFALDVTDEGSPRSRRTCRWLVGPIRILVNNAGILPRGNLCAPDGPRERWDRTMAVNVQGAFNVTMAFVEQLKLTRGTIVNIASINSCRGAGGSGAYPVSKGALAQFTRALASELAPDGGRVNALAPGLIATAMTEPTRADPKRLEAFLAHVPMKRVGEPEELAGPVVFLCSDAASYITGAILPVDGVYLGIRSGIIDLPRHAETVGDPGEQPAEAIVAHRHQLLAAVLEAVGKLAHPRLRIAVDEEGDGRREGEGVLDEAVAAHHRQPADREASDLDRAFGARLAGGVALHGVDTCVGEQRQVEVEGGEPSPPWNMRNGRTVSVMLAI